MILLDMNMPRMNGCDFTRQEMPQARTKIFMVTGSDTPPKVPPVDRWIKKPLNPDRLLREMRQLQTA